MNDPLAPVIPKKLSNNKILGNQFFFLLNGNIPKTLEWTNPYKNYVFNGPRGRRQSLKKSLKISQVIIIVSCLY